MDRNTLTGLYPHTANYELNIGRCEHCSGGHRLLLRGKDGRFACVPCTYQVERKAVRNAAADDAARKAAGKAEGRVPMGTPHAPAEMVWMSQSQKRCPVCSRRVTPWNGQKDTKRTACHGTHIAAMEVGA